MPELKLILNRTILIRRLKSEVLKQLPPKLRKIVYLKVPDSASNRKANKLFSSIQKLPNAMTTDDLERAGFNEDDLTEGTNHFSDGNPAGFQFSRANINLSIFR